MNVHQDITAAVREGAICLAGKMGVCMMSTNSTGTGFVANQIPI